MTEQEIFEKNNLSFKDSNLVPISKHTLITCMHDFANQSNTIDWKQFDKSWLSKIQELRGKKGSEWYPAPSDVISFIKTYFQSTPQKELKEENDKIIMECLQICEACGIKNSDLISRLWKLKNQ